MIIDIIVVALFLICIFFGVKKGFAKAVLGLFSYVVSGILALVFFDRFYDFLQSNSVTGEKLDQFKENVSGWIGSYIDVSDGDIPAIFKGTLTQLTDDVSVSLSNITVKAVCAVFFILAVIIVIKLLSKVITLAVKLPVLKQFNGILGGAVGAINGIIVCYILGAIILFFVLGSNSREISNQLSASVLGQYFYKNNIILNLLVGM
ncbi:MAG: CvpA family protein [Clostridia bacterium]|nr:CvpA family protein [Clostridia bacterium]